MRWGIDEVSFFFFQLCCFENSFFFYLLIYQLYCICLSFCSAFSFSDEYLLQMCVQIHKHREGEIKDITRRKTILLLLQYFSLVIWKHLYKIQNENGKKYILDTFSCFLDRQNLIYTCRTVLLNDTEMGMNLLTPKVSPGVQLQHMESYISKLSVWQASAMAGWGDQKTARGWGEGEEDT